MPTVRTLALEVALDHFLGDWKLHACASVSCLCGDLPASMNFQRRFSFCKVGALVYARFMWTRREKLGLKGGASMPGWREVKQFLGAGGAMVFRQVQLPFVSGWICFDPP